MIEAHVFSYEDRIFYENEWSEWLHLRHKVYIEDLKWHEPREDRRETDQFDNENAVYILGLEDGRVVTSARLISCDRPHLVSEVFPHFCEREGVPRYPNWMEWTRTLTIPELRSGGQASVLTQLSTAVMEYCLQRGVAYVGGIQELYFLPKWQHLGWKARPMGLPQMIEGSGECVVAYIEVSDEALQNARRLLGIDHPLLTSRVQRPEPLRDRFPPELEKPI